jgi:hypothetical protein
LKLIANMVRYVCLGSFLLLTACGGSSSKSTSNPVTPPASITPSTLAFTAATYTATSTATAVTVEVNRSGSTTGSASVNYTTVNGTAVAGTGYTAMRGTLNWTDGDSTAKSVAVPVVAGSSAMSFQVQLSAPVNASLSTPTYAMVSIAGRPNTGTANSALSIRVQGDHFIDANGVPLQLRGVNLGSLGFVAVQGWDPADPWGGNAPDFNAIKTWKSNVVRLPLNEASWLGYTCVDVTGASRDPDPGHNYQATVKKAVSDATSAGLYVVIDLHWSAPKNFCPLAQNPMADMDNSLNFWTSVAQTFKDYPNVMFELFNEPYFFWMATGETDWSVLLNGGTMTAYVTGNSHTYTAQYTWTSAGMQQMLNAVRGTGATNVVLVAGVNWAQDLTEWVAHKPTDANKQIAAVWHAYPNSGTVGDPQAAVPKFGAVAYTWTQAVITAGYPVFITEFGDHNAPGTMGAPFVSNLLPWADEHGASYTGWTWNPWQEPDNVLIKDESGTPTDGYGVYTKAHFICAATGSSNCP